MLKTTVTSALIQQALCSLYLLVWDNSNNALLFKNLLLTLGVEEASHPKGFGSSFKHPTAELFVSLQKLCEPKAQCGRLPGDFLPQVWHTGIKNIVQGITEVLGVKYRSEVSQDFTPSWQLKKIQSSYGISEIKIIFSLYYIKKTNMFQYCNMQIFSEY